MKKQSEKSGKPAKRALASSMRLALENRLLFDGAVVAAAAAAAEDQNTAAAAEPPEDAGEY